MSPRVLPNVFYLLVNSVGRAALGVTLVKGLGDEWRDTLQSYVDRNGKITKFEVAYSPVAPPPVFWEYNCGECVAFLRDEKQCKWVDVEGLINPGIIHPQGWCVIWMPKDGERQFSYVGKVPWFIRETAPIFP